MDNMIFSKLNAVALASLIALSLSSSVQAAVSCSCPVGYNKVGAVCVKVKPPACPVGMSLKVDYQGLVDRCVRPNNAHNVYPTHPAGTKKLTGWLLFPKNGIDQWKKTAVCARWTLGVPLKPFHVD